jgi:hypothetical protein
MLYSNNPTYQNTALNARQNSSKDPIHAIVPRNLRHYVQIERFKHFSSVVNANLHRWYEGDSLQQGNQSMKIPDYTHGYYKSYPPYGIPPESHFWQELQNLYRGRAAWKPGFILAARMALEGKVGDFSGTSFESNPFDSSPSEDSRSAVMYEHQLTKDELFHYLRLEDMLDDMTPVEEREEQLQSTQGRDPDPDTVQDTSSDGQISEEGLE